MVRNYGACVCLTVARECDFFPYLQAVNGQPVIHIAFCFNVYSTKKKLVSINTTLINFVPNVISLTVHKR